MLVLKRKVGEVIVIGDDVRVTVTSIDQGKVDLGIEAPKGVKILRAELREQACCMSSESTAG